MPSVVAVWGRLQHSPGHSALVALLDRICGRRVADGLRMPFALGEIDVLSALYREAGDEVMK